MALSAAESRTRNCASGDDFQVNGTPDLSYPLQD